MGDDKRSMALVSVQYATDLVRSLVGVERARVVTNGGGAFDALEVVPEEGIQDSTVIRNVRSALRAALDIDLPLEAVRVVPRLPEEEPAKPAQLVVIQGGVSGVVEASDPAHRPATPAERATPRRGSSAAPEPAPRSMPRGGGRRGDVVAATSGNLAYDLVEEPRALRIVAEEPAAAAVPAEPGTDDGVPRVESVILERENHWVRCRVVMALDGRTQEAAAAAEAGPGMDVQVSARAAVDALAAFEGPFRGLTLEMASLTTLGGRRNVIASVCRGRGAGAQSCLVGAADVTGKMEEAAALAVVRAALHHMEGER